MAANSSIADGKQHGNMQQPSAVTAQANNYIATAVFAERTYEASLASIKKQLRDGRTRPMSEQLHMLYTALHYRLPVAVCDALNTTKTVVDKTESAEIGQVRLSPEKYFYRVISVAGICPVNTAVYALRVGSSTTCPSCSCMLTVAYPFGLCDMAQGIECPECHTKICVNAADPGAVPKYIGVHKTDLAMERMGGSGDSLHAGSLPIILPTVLVDQLPARMAARTSVHITGILLPGERTDQLVRKKRGSTVAVATPFQLALFALSIEIARVENNGGNGISSNSSTMGKRGSLSTLTMPALNSGRDRLWRELSMFVRSYQPAISGRCIEKLLCLLACTSSAAPFRESSDNAGVDVNGSATGIWRSALHVLLLGDAGVGKTRLIELAARICPQSEYLQARRSTKAGLAAGGKATGGSGGSDVRMGAMARCDSGILCVDELAELPRLREQLAQTMDHQLCTTAKAGVYTIWPARCAVLAACNPQTKTHEYDVALGLMDNMGKLAEWTMAFDLIVVMTDERRTPSDRKEVSRTTALTSAMIIDDVDGDELVVPPISSSSSPRLEIPKRKSTQCPCDTYLPRSSVLLHEHICRAVDGDDNGNGESRHSCYSEVELHERMKVLRDHSYIALPDSWVPALRKAVVDEYVQLLTDEHVVAAQLDKCNLLATLLRLTMAIARLVMAERVTGDMLDVAVLLVKHVAAVVSQCRTVNKRVAGRGGKAQAVDRLWQHLLNMGSGCRLEHAEVHKMAMAMGLNRQEATNVIDKLVENGQLLQSGSALIIHE